MKVSIILPVYNSEKTIRRIIDSIIAQTEPSWELIVIDDGSTDSSPTIIDQYSELDTRICVVHKSNGGVSAARQTGLLMVRGDYVIHADSDDWIDSDMLENMLNAIGDSDILITDFYSNAENQTVSIQAPSNCKDNIEILKDLFSTLHGSCCNKLVRTATIRKYGAQFFAGINFAEDLLFFVQLLVNSEVKVTYLNKAYYHYYCPTSHQSLCSSYSKKYLQMGRMFVEKIEVILPPNIKDEIVGKYKIGLKFGAFEHPIYTKEEYLSIYPKAEKYMSLLNLSRVNSFLFRMSMHGFYFSATHLYKLKNKMTGHIVR